MVISWWWLWLCFLLLFLITPIGYGWGYRRWGPPYPRYIQRRRSERAAARPGSSTFDHHAWGWAGDFVWVVLIIAFLWLIMGAWQR
ncbi:MAG: hypothetical protein ABR998_15550 [Gemmatimonadales bacterium]